MRGTHVVEEAGDGGTYLIVQHTAGLLSNTSFFCNSPCGQIVWVNKLAPDVLYVVKNNIAPDMLYVVKNNTQVNSKSQQKKIPWIYCRRSPRHEIEFHIESLQILPSKCQRNIRHLYCKGKGQKKKNVNKYCKTKIAFLYGDAKTGRQETASFSHLRPLFCCCRIIDFVGALQLLEL